MADHTTPLHKPSLRADIDSPEFRELLAWVVRDVGEPQKSFHRKNLIAHINAHTTRAVEAAVAADKHDAERWRFRKQFLTDRGAIMFTASNCQLRRTGELVSVGNNEEEAIDHAIAAATNKETE